MHKNSLQCITYVSYDAPIYLKLYPDMEKCINKQINLVSKLSNLPLRYCANDFSCRKVFTSTNWTAKIPGRRVSSQ